MQARLCEAGPWHGQDDGEEQTRERDWVPHIPQSSVHFDHAPQFPQMPPPGGHAVVVGAGDGVVGAAVDGAGVEGAAVLGGTTAIGVVGGAGVDGFGVDGGGEVGFGLHG